MRLIQSGDIPSGTQLMDNWNVLYRQIGLSDIETLIDRGVTFTADGGQFAEAYIDADGRNNSVDTTNTSAKFDTDKYSVNTTTIITIEATSISSTGDFAINNCSIKEVATGKWFLTSSSADLEVGRAEIYKTLFYGTDGSNPRASSTYITGITALKTNVARDVGKRAHYAEVRTDTVTSSSDGRTIYTGTFDETSTNSDCSVWAYGFGDATTSQGTNAAYADFNGSNILTANKTTVDETGTDTTADETDNPTTVVTRTDMNSSSAETNWAIGRVFTLCEGDITWVLQEIDDSGTTSHSSDTTDFFTDNSIPLFTDGSSEPEINLITHTIPAGTFSSTLSSAFLTFKAEDWESGADVQYQLRTADPLTINQNSFVEISATSINEIELTINNCVIIPKSAGVWILGSTTTGDDEVARSEVYKTLFYGTNGSNPKVTSAITSLTTLKTSVARDVGKQAHYVARNHNQNVTIDSDGVFANTTTNTAVSSWSYMDPNPGKTMFWQIPTGTTVHTTTSAISSEYGIDTSADETDNPTNCRLESTSSGTGAYNMNALVLCVGDITWTPSGGGTETTIDFATDYLVPLLTSGASLPGSQEDTEYVASNEVVSFTALNAEPRELVVKLIPKTTSPTAGYPSINGVALYGDRPA